MASDGTLKFDTSLDTGGLQSGMGKVASVAQQALGVFTGQMMTRAVDALANLGKSALDSVGQLEQNVGGVETLFGDAADAVIASADRAYQTAGISQVKLGELKGIGTSVTVTATGDNLGDKLYEIEKTQELSHRLRYDYLNNDLIFEVWKGKDRTDDQTENSWAIFSDSFYNVKNAVYDRDESEYKNFAYVAGEGEGSARVIVGVDLRSSADEERRELYVDARDLQSTYQDDAGDEHTYTADQYRALLRQRGLEKLAEYQKIETVNSDVDPNANLTYGVDFDLGDLCTYRYADVGIETTKRITEIQEVYEGSKQTISVVFGNDQMTSITKIIQREVF